MKHIIFIAALVLSGCGGSSSSPIASEPIVEEIIKEVVVTPECEVCPPETVCPTCPICPVEEEPEPVIETYYQISTATRDGENIQERVYDEQGYLLSDYNELSNTWYKYAYDENHNQTSFTIERDGSIISYTYATFDENSNQLTSVSDTGRVWTATYDENNHRIRLEIDYGDGITRVELYTYEGDNLVKIEKLYENRVENRRFDAYGNMIYSDIWIDEKLEQVETFTWEAFTREI